MYGQSLCKCNTNLPNGLLPDLQETQSHEAMGLLGNGTLRSCVTTCLNYYTRKPWDRFRLGSGRKGLRWLNTPDNFWTLGPPMRFLLKAHSLLFCHTTSSILQGFPPTAASYLTRINLTNQGSLSYQFLRSFLPAKIQTASTPPPHSSSRTGSAMGLMTTVPHVSKRMARDLGSTLHTSSGFLYWSWCRSG